MAGAAVIIAGSALAESLKQDVRKRVAALGRPVHLAAVLVGATPAGEMYAQRQADACRNVGIDYESSSSRRSIDSMPTHPSPAS